MNKNTFERVIFLGLPYTKGVLMLKALPANIDEVKDWTWADVVPFFEKLQAVKLSAANVDEWLTDWTDLGGLLQEVFSRAQLGTIQNTVDEEAETHFKRFMAEIFPPMTQANNLLNKKLVESTLEPDNFEVPLRKMRNEIELFREENLPLMVKEQALSMEYGKITGAQLIEWEGEEVTPQQMNKVQEDEDRDKRERAWRLTMDRWLRDRQTFNKLWVESFDLHREMAKNAGFDNFRDFRWKQFNRFDYTPADCETFHNAIEEVVVPAAQRVNERRRQRLGLDTLRPWDLAVDTSGLPPLRPWETIEEFAEKAETIFSKVDPQLGEYFGIMRQEELLDMPNRKNKGPGANCRYFPTTKRPFIFMNAVGTKGDVRTLIHESGHAFHGFEASALPYLHMRRYPIEFAEVASMSMELLAGPYLTKDQGGYFTKEEAARDRVSHLEKILSFWPYMAVVDAFQLWAHGGGDDAKDPAACDAKWSELWDRFMKVDYSGLQDIKETGWHRKLHIYRYPFYYVEYGLAQLGAVQVWANSLQDQAQAVADYRYGLSLGGTRTVTGLFEAVGARFAFDAGTMGEFVGLIEKTIDELENV
jgi:oligoendopeptidase F